MIGKRFFIVLVILGIGFSALLLTRNSSSLAPSIKENISNSQEDAGGIVNADHPLSIEFMRAQEYPGNDVVIEQTLPPGSNYDRYIVSYRSDGLKIYALLTVPQGAKPETGWPVMIFNHGYIPPSEYRTTERYIAYTDAFSRNSYIVFRPDYRGYGNSEGNAEGAYGSPAYTIDVLNAVSSMKREGTDMVLRQAQGITSRIINPEKFGMWGHSMGGSIVLRSMVVSKDIKAGVIWAGVVGSYPDLINRWRRRPSIAPTIPGGRGGWRQSLIAQYGQPEKNPTFWNSISPNSYLKDISGPIQLHHGTADSSVPIAFSKSLEQQLKDAGQTVESYYYDGDDHDISGNLDLALQRSVDFFDKYLKDKQ